MECGIKLSHYYEVAIGLIMHRNSKMTVLIACSLRARVSPSICSTSITVTSFLLKIITANASTFITFTNKITYQKKNRIVKRLSIQ